MPLPIRIFLTLCGYMLLGFLTRFCPGPPELRQILIFALIIMAVGYFAQAMGWITSLPPLGLR